MHYASCTGTMYLHHAPCTPYLGPCWLWSCCAPFPPLCGNVATQLRAAHSALSMQDGHQDPVCTPKRRDRRDRDQTSGRYASGSGHVHNYSRSCSPTRWTPQRSSPPPYNRSQQQSPSKTVAFPSGTAHQGLPACALCLATDPHDTRKCRSETLWDGSKARCRKSDEGRLITPAGTTLCSDWNNRRGCSSSAHEQRHECSGCGSKDMPLSAEEVRCSHHIRSKHGNPCFIFVTYLSNIPTSFSLCTKVSTLVYSLFILHPLPLIAPACCSTL